MVRGSRSSVEELLQIYNHSERLCICSLQIESYACFQYIALDFFPSHNMQTRYVFTRNLRKS